VSAIRVFLVNLANILKLFPSQKPCLRILSGRVLIMHTNCRRYLRSDCLPTMLERLL